MLKPGQKIPLNLKVKNHLDQGVELSSFLDQLLVIYFYPKDDTPGCTIQAQQFNHFRSALNELGVKIVGVSKDSPRLHQAFKEKYGLNFELLSDETHRLHQAFGVWQEKRRFGASYQGAVRSTFAVDERGDIVKVWPRAEPKDNAKEVYQFFKDFNQAEKP